MAIIERLVIPVLVTVVGAFVAVRWTNWIVKFIAFLAAFGGLLISAGIVGLDVAWVLALESALLLATGITSLRVKHAGNKVLGIILTILGVVGVLLTLNQFGATPGTILGNISGAIQQGLVGFFDFINMVLGLA